MEKEADRRSVLPENSLTNCLNQGIITSRISKESKIPRASENIGDRTALRFGSLLNNLTKHTRNQRLLRFWRILNQQFAADCRIDIATGFEGNYPCFSRPQRGRPQAARLSAENARRAVPEPAAMSSACPALRGMRGAFCTIWVVPRKIPSHIVQKAFFVLFRKRKK